MIDFNSIGKLGDSFKNAFDEINKSMNLMGDEHKSTKDIMDSVLKDACISIKNRNESDIVKVIARAKKMVSNVGKECGIDESKINEDLNKWQ